MTSSHLQRIQRSVVCYFPALVLLSCAAPQRPAPDPDPLWRLRRVGMPLRPVARSWRPAVSPAAKPPTVPRPQPEQPGQALAVLGSRLGKPPGATQSCAAATADSPSGVFDICLGDGLPPPLREALVAERRDSTSGVVVAVTAELAFPAGTGAAELRFAELGALLRQTYGAPRRIGPQLQEFTAGRYAVALELVKDLGGQSYVYLDLGAPVPR